MENGKKRAESTVSVFVNSSCQMLVRPLQTLKVYNAVDVYIMYRHVEFVDSRVLRFAPLFTYYAAIV